MSTPLKGNEHIEADDRAFKDAVERAGRELARIKGVVGVGYGIREKDGKFGDELAILVYVTRKLPDGELSPEQRIPASFDGYRTDVRVLLPSEPLSNCNDQGERGTLVGGIQIEAGGKYTFKKEPAVGTLGCIVHKRGGGEGGNNVYLLTCHHVLWLEDETNNYSPLIFKDDGVFHPFSPHSDQVRPGKLLGKITRALSFKGHIGADRKPVPDEPRLKPAPYDYELPADFHGNYVDCAAVRIDLGSFCCGSACTPNELRHATTIPDTNIGPMPSGLTESDRDRVTDVRDLRNEPASALANLRVVKNGRTTGRTVGRVVGIGPGHSIVYPVAGDPGRVTLVAHRVLEIVRADPPPAFDPCLFLLTNTQQNTFSWYGDSGSLVLDERNRAVGLVFSGGSVANVGGARKTHAALIVPVLDALGMCIPTTTGHAYGSSKATDGSGIAMYGGDWELPTDDKVLFARAETGGVLTREHETPLAPPAATDEQRARMQPMLEKLRETQRGRELHEDFTQLSREIAYLVRRCRPVTVAWHRHRGPAFLACAISHLKGEAAQIPHTIQGVSRHSLLTRMETVLRQHGSNALRDALDRHRASLLSCSEAVTVGECLEVLRRFDTAEVTA